MPCPNPHNTTRRRTVHRLTQRMLTQRRKGRKGAEGTNARRGTALPCPNTHNTTRWPTAHRPPPVGARHAVPKPPQHHPPAHGTPSPTRRGTACRAYMPLTPPVGPRRCRAQTPTTPPVGPRRCRAQTPTTPPAGARYTVPDCNSPASVCLTYPHNTTRRRTVHRPPPVGARHAVPICL